MPMLAFSAFSVGRRSFRLSKRVKKWTLSDSFVNSQEWTISRTVPDLRLGIIGNLNSGKSALVHRYLTGSYMQDESPEGGRFKKEVFIDGQSYLLLIRDEGGPPEMQFSCWVDAVVFVFSLENESSFNAIQNYYTKMMNYSNNADIPIILVGTQDATGDCNPRIIDEARAKKLASELRKCSYYETCATYGLNVERVFQDACQKIVQTKFLPASSNSSSRPNTPSTNQTFFRHNPANNYVPLTPQNNGNISFLGSSNNLSSPTHSTSKQEHKSHIKSNNQLSNNKVVLSHFQSQSNEKIISSISSQGGPIPPKRIESKLESSKSSTFVEPSNSHLTTQSIINNTKDIITPGSTPTTARKTRRRSNLFPHISNKNKNLEEKNKNGELGSGRAIPVKQGYLYKKSIKSLNKDWKKKYVTLTADGKLTYHPTLHDYMEDVHGKDIPLKHTTVKIPGQKPRGSRIAQPNNHSQNSNDISSDLNHLSLGSVSSNDKLIPCTNPLLGKDTPNIKKKHRRIKSKGNEGMDDSDGYEFMVVSLENKQWHFEASNSDERKIWVEAIEEQILSSLQGMDSDKYKESVQIIRSIKGNSHCFDCDAPNPSWASLNLGVVICIECSGIHRNLGTHISRVRSLDLDDWPPGHTSVMMAIGNAAALKTWEFNTKGRVKPTPNSSREEKERWIRAKYEIKEFLAPLDDKIRIEQQLIDAVSRCDVLTVALILAHTPTSDQVNKTYSKDAKTPLLNPIHIAASRGRLHILQLLLWHNGNAKSIDGDGKTALFYARNIANKDVEDLLIQHGCVETTSAFSNGGNLAKKRSSLSTVASKAASDVFEHLPASII